MKKWFALLLISVFLASTLQVVFSTQRFPKPEFESGHVVPKPHTPNPRSNNLEILDLGVLFMALSLASLFALKTRSRTGIFWLTVFTLIYFGFWRKGCVCSVGSIQNVTLALFDKTVVLPFTVIGFFGLPLLFTLFFGRTFCAGVCPLGAIQDLIVLKPVRIPGWLEKVLGFFPYLYLGFAVLFAATAADFIICRYDPFVGIFRFGANFPMIPLGLGLLILGIFVARPYCRFLCPYGVLLNWMSRLSWKHMTITPEDCVQCRLCEDSCPFGAILVPTPEKPPDKREREIKRLGVMIILLPLLVLGGGFLGSRLEGVLSGVHKTVRLAEQVRIEEVGKTTQTTVESETFQSSGKSLESLYQEAKIIKKKFKRGGWILGSFIGAVIGFMLIGFSIRRRRTDYIPDRGACFSCGRCFSFCPVGKQNKHKKGLVLKNERK